MNYRPSQTAPEMIHRGARLVIPRRRVCEIVRCIQKRAIPKLVKIPVELVRTGFRDIVDLRRSISSLVHRVRERVDGHFRNRVQTQHEIGRQAAVEIGEGIVRFESVHDVAIGERRKSVELHVAKAVGTADEIIAVPRGIDERAGRELQRVGEVSAWIGEVFQCRRIEIRGCIRVSRVDEGRRAAYFNGLVGLRHSKREIDRLLLPQT